MESQQKEMLQYFEYINKGTISDDDIIVLHEIAEGVRDFGALQKQTVQAELDVQDKDTQDEWADPVDRQYKAIFQSIQHIED